MNRFALGPVAVLLLALSACLPSAVEQLPVTFNGTVTDGGVAVEGAEIEIFGLGEGGLPVSRGTTLTDASGAYSISTQVDEPRCFLAYIEVEVRDAGGALLHEGRRNADGCGTTTADFAF